MATLPSFPLQKERDARLHFFQLTYVLKHQRIAMISNYSNVDVEEQKAWNCNAALSRLVGIRG
jgi:hypothetical protein